MMTTEERIILAAAHLARSAPGVWEEFIAAIAVRVAEANENLVASELGMLQVNQGRAQAYRALFTTLRDSASKLEVIERTERERESAKRGFTGQ